MSSLAGGPAHSPASGPPERGGAGSKKIEGRASGHDAHFVPGRGQGIEESRRPGWRRPSRSRQR